MSKRTQMWTSTHADKLVWMKGAWVEDACDLVWSSIHMNGGSCASALRLHMWSFMRERKYPPLIQVKLHVWAQASSTHTRSSIPMSEGHKHLLLTPIELCTTREPAIHTPRLPAPGQAVKLERLGIADLENLAGEAISYEMYHVLQSLFFGWAGENPQMINPQSLGKILSLQEKCSFNEPNL